MTVLTINNAVKIRGDRETVSQVSLNVTAGERVALLGHNGAGKTTLIRMILGLTPLDGGEISIDGHLPGSTAARRITAFLPENVAFHGALTGKEQIRFFARIRGEKYSKADDLLERVGLKDHADRRISAYSKGMRQRLGLAQALLGNARLSLLDEPTSGLDPVARWEFYAIVEEFAAAGGAVLLSSHALTELEARTDRIAILRAGKLAANGDLKTLRRAVELPLRFRITAQPDSAQTLIDNLGGRRVNGCAVEITCPIDQKMARLEAINAVRHLVEDLEIVPPDLEALYRHFSASEEAGP